MKNTFLILIACSLAGIICGQEFLRFDQTEWKLGKTKSAEENTNLRIEKTPLNHTGRTVPSIAWDSPPTAPVSLYLQGKHPLEEFNKAEFTLKVHSKKILPLRRIVLRLVDRTGEVFQLPPKETGILQAGENLLHYSLDASAPQANIWGGDKNQKLDWPLKVSGIAIDFVKNTQTNAQIQLDSLNYTIGGERITTSLQTGHKFNLLLPKQNNPPTLVIGNVGTEPLELHGKMMISDVDGNTCEAPISTQVAVNTEASIVIPGNFATPGWWRVDYQLKSTSGKEFSGTHRFACMNPAGPTPGRAQEFLFGLCGHPERFSREAVPLEAEAAGLCGAKIYRTDFSWTRLQPQREQWDFSQYDYIVNEFWKNGVEMQAILSLGTHWAIPPADPKQGNNKPSIDRLPSDEDYSKFTSTVALHYRDKIRYIEIGNEPDLKGLSYSSEGYMRMLYCAYDAIKHAVPDAKVMSGGIAGIGSNTIVKPSFNNHLLDMLRDDAGRSYDIFAFHGHATFTLFATYLRAMRQYHLTTPDAARPWYANETAISSALLGERAQAPVVFKKMLFVWANGAIGYNWYLLRDKEYYPIGHYEHHFGMLTTEFEPKPVYIAYNMLANIYKGGKFLRELELVHGAYTYLFEDKNKCGLLALWTEGVPRTILLSGLPAGTQQIDLYGNERPLTIQDGLACVRLSGTPFTLRFPNARNAEIRNAGEIMVEDFPQQLAIPAGDVAKLDIPVSNPLPRSLKLTIDATATDGIGTSLDHPEITIPANNTSTAQLQLKAPKNFHATLANPARLRLTITPTGFDSETVTLPIASSLPGEIPEYRLNQVEQYHSIIESAPGNERLYWQGPPDLSADVYMSTLHSSYDGSRKLQLRVVVTDDIHFQPDQGKETETGDNLQFGIKIPQQNGFWKISLTSLADGKPEAICLNHPAGFKVNNLDSIHFECNRDESKKKTTYQVEIPFRLIGITPDLATEGFRFNLIVNDHDGERPEGFIAVAPGLGIEDDVNLWPTVKLP